MDLPAVHVRSWIITIWLVSRLRSLLEWILDLFYGYSLRISQIRILMLIERLQIHSSLINLINILYAGALIMFLNIAIFVQGLQLHLFFGDSGEASCLKSAKIILFWFHQQFVWNSICFDIHRRFRISISHSTILQWLVDSRAYNCTCSTWVKGACHLLFGWIIELSYTLAGTCLGVVIYINTGLQILIALWNDGWWVVLKSLNVLFNAASLDFQGHLLLVPP